MLMTTQKVKYPAAMRHRLETSFRGYHANKQHVIWPSMFIQIYCMSYWAHRKAELLKQSCAEHTKMTHGCLMGIASGKRLQAGVIKGRMGQSPMM